MPPAAELPPEPQTAPAVLLVRPAHFASNRETLASNRFQADAPPSAAIATAARRETDAVATTLAAAGVRVLAFAGSRDAALPDEVFPNNWVSFHADGTAILYPLLAPSRRAERRPELLEGLRAQGYRLERVIDLSPLERRGEHLEGTGSLVLDRARRVAYACLSPRTHSAALDAFAAATGYEIAAFAAVDRDGVPIYHTNVVMALGTSFAVLCTAAIEDPGTRRAIVARLERSGREVIDLELAQLHAFAGNLLELRSRTGPVVALSARALASLDAAQRDALARHGRLVPIAVDTIERYGGGSVRCMLAEVPLPRG